MNLTMPPVAPVAFNGLAAFAWIAIFLLVGMTLRAVFPVFRKYLIPACIIGGCVGLVFQGSGLINATGFQLDYGITQNIVFHLFNLTWIFIGLRMPATKKASKVAETKRVLWTAGLTTAIGNISTAFAMIASSLLVMIGLNSGPHTLGALTAWGFIAGPGQALTMANVWTNTSEFLGLPDYALAGGAMGYLVAILVGIFMMNIIARKKKINTLAHPSDEEECGFYNDCTPKEEAGSQTTSTTSIDVLAWHFALGLATYFVAFMIAVGLSFVLPRIITIAIWAMFNLYAIFIAVIVRNILIKLNKSHLLCSGINNRISNSLVDFVVCATFMSIEIGNVLLYMLPFIASTVVLTISIGTITWMFTRKLQEDGPETFAYLFGNFTGTTSTSFILLRLVDPMNKSQVPVRVAFANMLCFPVGIGLQMLYHMEVVYGRPPWIPIVAVLAIGVIGLILAIICRQPQTATAWEPDSNS